MTENPGMNCQKKPAPVVPFDEAVVVRSLMSILFVVCGGEMITEEIRESLVNYCWNYKF